jgi:high-affinity Fe2+/Pb2+ permease
MRDATPEVGVERHRLRADTQDLGASLAVIMGTAAATVLAKAVAAWLSRNSGARIEIRRGTQIVLVANHLDSKDVARIAEAFSPKVP